MKAFFLNLIDLIFPPKCVICGKVGDLVCKPCQRKIGAAPDPCCPICRKPTTSGRCCRDCAPGTRLASLITAGELNHPSYKKIIVSYKYEHLSALAPFIASRMARVAKKEKLNSELITFVPLSRKRRASRGYNQSELLAREISQALKIPNVSLLRKTRETKTQVGLGREARAKNLKGAFECLEPTEVEGRRVVVIDDVYTTGATLEACAKVLLSAGAKEVVALTAARE